jgi:curved DNA-binding protein CbpA
MTKDYYRILGVLDDAEDIVIRAAYKVLAQKYHPDKWKGDKAEATRRMSDINEAYGVLSDTAKRKQYDSTRDKAEYQEDSEEDEWNNYDSSLVEAWDIGIEFFPELNAEYEKLKRMNLQLANTFKLKLIENKCFDEGVKISVNMQQEFLTRYFGSDNKITKFAQSLINSNYKDTLKYLNKVINIMGQSVKAEVVINKVLEKYPIELNLMRPELLSLANEIQNYYHQDLTIFYKVLPEKCILLLNLFFINVEVNKNFNNFQFDQNGVSMSFDKSAFINYVKERFVKRVLDANK